MAEPATAASAAGAGAGGGGGAQPDFDAAGAPWNFLALSRAFGPSRAFQVAVKIGLFGALSAHAAAHGAGATWQQLAAELGLKADPSFRGVVDLLDLLVVEGCLLRQGDGPGALYSNTPDGERYLVPGRPDYIGGLVVVNAERSFPQFVYLEDSLRTGSQPPAAKELVLDVLSMFGGAGDPAATARFAQGMTGANLAAFKALAVKFDFSRYSSLLDVGGSAASLSCTLAAAHPHLRAVSADLPAVRGAAEASIAAAGLQGRVAAAELDFFSGDAFPKADVVTMSMILHDWGTSNKIMLMKKAFAALPPGGAFIALDLIIDDARRANRWGLYQSLSMLTEFDSEGAFDYTFEDFRGWAAAAGFSRCELLHLEGPASAAVAYR